MAEEVSAEDPLNEVAALVNGCRDDPEGIETKRAVVKQYCDTSSSDLLDVLCALRNRA